LNKPDGSTGVNDIIYVAISLGLFVLFAAAILGYERVE
jgi:hypothetical protein